MRKRFNILSAYQNISTNKYNLPKILYAIVRSSTKSLTRRLKYSQFVPRDRNVKIQGSNFVGIKDSVLEKGIPVRSRKIFTVPHQETPDVLLYRQSNENAFSWLCTLRNLFCFL